MNEPAPITDPPTQVGYRSAATARDGRDAVVPTRWTFADLRWPLVVFVVIAGLTLGMWYVQSLSDRREADYTRARAAEETARRAERILAAEVHRAQDLASLVTHGVVRDADTFATAVGRDVKPDGAALTVAWVAREGVCDYVWTRRDETVLVKGENLSARPGWAATLRKASHRRTPELHEVTPAAELIFVAPSISGEGTAAAYLGCVVSRVDLRRALEQLVPPALGNAYDYDLSDGLHTVLASGRPIDSPDESVSSEPVALLGGYLRLRIRPTDAAVRAQASAPYILLIGLPCAAVLAAGLARALRRRSVAAATARHHVEALGTLMQTAGVISTAAGQAPQALQRLAESARELLRMRTSVVGLLDPTGECVDVVAQAGTPFHNPRPRYLLREATGTRECIRTGQVFVVENVEHDPRVNGAVLRENGLRSALMVPLKVENRVTGSIFLGDDRLRQFGPAERELARVLGSQAGVILSNFHLYQEKDSALAMERELRRRHEALYRIATEIYRGADLDDSLQRLADDAPAVLKVDLCMVSVPSGEDEVRIAAITANFANCRGERTRASTSNISRVWRTREPLVIADAPNDPSVHPAYLHRLHVGSIVYLPLIGGGGELVGTMTLVRHAVGPFDEEQLDLARVLAARAAEAIQAATMHESARRAAQTQEVLLKELNHRVKNNLASIVTLLSIERPDMSPEALAWLNRASERVATMARTHELFVGGRERVDLRDLVAKLLPALSLIKPAGADVRADLDGVDVELGTERAVGLAMVLNELCWNALEHGTSPNGVLLIRARGAEGRRLVLEIEDDGGGERPPTQAPGAAGNTNVDGNSLKACGTHGRGTGLRLVEGLVSRELRGTFVMNRTPAGGMIARVEIPLEDAEAVRLSL